MKKNTFLILLIFITFTRVYSQPLFKRAWGTVKNDIARPNMAEIIPSTGDLSVFYRVGEYNGTTTTTNEIYRFNRSNAAASRIYQFPPAVKVGHQINGTSLFNNFKIDSNNNYIIVGRTFKDSLATSGAYSSQMIIEPYYSSGFITKVSPSGKVLWFTYFYGISQNTEQLTIDKNNNIYIVSKRYKESVLNGSNFQNTGDLSSGKKVQDVISKFDTNGKHQWSTFYVKDDSVITAIEAGTNGLYVYGDHFGSNVQSNYFGTKNSYQEYASGVMLWNAASSATNAFLTKFNFDGTRAWSTYFGEQISQSVYNHASMNVKTLKVVGDDAYFLTKHTNVSSMAPSLATGNAFLTSPPSKQDPVTLTKVNGSGKREWTTYLYAADVLSRSVAADELHLSATVESNHPNIGFLTNSQSYQQQHNGMKDIYSYTMSLDGKKVNYASFYGFEGNDVAISFPTVDGYYIIGWASQYKNDSTNSFITAGTQSDTFKPVPLPPPYNYDGYSGNFIAFFTNKRLSTNEEGILNRVNIYPNPALETLHIQTAQPLTEDTQITVFDVTGKRVLTAYAKATELNEINVGSLNSGVYILQLSSSNINQSFKFIKK